jgi:glycosyltransferase involved in cell wall biosynthesis
MATLSVVTITLNEEQNIAACLDSVRWADEVIVLDSGSTDRTVEIAKAYTPHVLHVQWQGYGGTRNSALQRATGDWILWLDADERVTPELAEEIRRMLKSADPHVAGFAVARRAFFLGRWIRHSGWYPSRVVRLFRKSSGLFTETHVHEQLKIDGPVVNLRHDLLHYTDPDLFHYFAKYNRYTSLAAQDIASSGRRFSVLDLLVRPPFLFVKMYILRLGVLDGMEGLILAVVSASYVFTKYAKLWELQFHSPRRQS